MRGTGVAKLAAVSVAVVAHGALALALVATEDAQIDGARGGAEVRLGSAFADMSSGVVTAERAEDTEAIPSVVPEVIQTDRPVQTPSERPVRAVEADRNATFRPEVTPILQAAQPVAPVAAEVATAPIPEDVEVLAPSSTPEAMSPAPPADRIGGASSNTAAVVQSLRPKPRSARFEAGHKPPTAARSAAQSVSQPAAAAKPQRGNADQNARSGEVTGTAAATARQSGDRGRQSNAGNAAVSNYPGQVMRKLSRASKPRVTARGTALVAFTIGANGALATVSLARSSGSRALDQAAVQLVRGAGPFPEPPHGAQRSFSIQIQGQ